MNKKWYLAVALASAVLQVRAVAPQRIVLQLEFEKDGNTLTRAVVLLTSDDESFDPIPVVGACAQWPKVDFVSRSRPRKYIAAWDSSFFHTLQDILRAISREALEEHFDTSDGFNWMSKSQEDDSSGYFEILPHTWQERLYKVVADEIEKEKNGLLPQWSFFNTIKVMLGWYSLKRWFGYY